METWKTDPLKPQTQIMRSILVLLVMVSAIALLQGCGGSSIPVFSTPTVNNPAPGVTLVAIQITPSSSLIGLAENRQMLAMGVYSNGGSTDITQEVNWSASSAPSNMSNVAVTSAGLVTGMAIGSAVVSATAGSVTGLIQLIVETNGFTTGTTAILAVPYKTTITDVAYLPQQTMIQGAYAVQEVNLDADQFSNVLPVPVALLASVPMPAGFVPNATAASPTSFLVAVISYTSPDVQIIDAGNLPDLDLANNTVIHTFTAPVTEKTTLDGIECMICAAVVNPVTNQLLLSTAEGYFTMDLVTGKFTALLFTPSALPAHNFSLNPIAASPYILASNPATGQVQNLNLATNTVTTVNTGLTAPNAVALDLVTGYGAVVDADVNSQSLLTLTDPQNPLFSLASGIGVCGPPALQNLNMVALGVSQNVVPSNAAHTLFTSQTSGNCVGFEIWPPPSGSGQSQGQLEESQVAYGYGSMPNTPDGYAFLNSNDPNAIATFNSVVDKKNYGILIDGNQQAGQQWIAKINFNNVFANSFAITSSFLPGGYAIPSAGLCATLTVCSPVPITFLPAPSTVLTLSVSSISFGSVRVGISSVPIPVTLANIGAAEISPQISVQGANAGDFPLIFTCNSVLEPHSSCTINVTFTPTAAGARSASLTVSSSGGNTQTVPLSGTGT